MTNQDSSLSIFFRIRAFASMNQSNLSASQILIDMLKPINNHSRNHELVLEYNNQEEEIEFDNT